MEIKDILLLIRPGESSGPAAAAAAELARTHHAHVSALCLTPLPALEVSDCYAMGADAVHDVVARMDREAEAAAQTIEAPARAALKAAGCDFACCRTPPGEGAAETALRARVCDLVIMNRPGVHGVARRDAEILLRLGGAPCLLIPPKARAPRYGRVALAWNGSRQAKRALDDALPILIRADMVHVLVADEPDWGPWSSEAVVEHLVRHGAPARLARLAPNGGPKAHALLEACRDMDADLLVMGAFGRAPQAEHWLGGTTWTVLTTAPLPVVMSC